MLINYKKFSFSSIFLSILFIIEFIVAVPVNAVNYILEGIDCIKTGLCTPCDLIQVGVNGTEMILGLSGVVVLLIFIYGGLMWMISYGDAQKVSKGTAAIKAAVIGMIVIFISYSLVELLWQALRGNKEFSNSVQCTPLNIQSNQSLNNNIVGPETNQTINTNNNQGTTIDDVNLLDSIPSEGLSD